MLIVFLAIFTQTVSGFGLALVSMPLLVGMMSVKTATPLVALFGLVAEVLLLLRYREAFDLRAVLHLVVASLIGMPVGIWLLDVVDTALITKVLGVLITGYAIYALLKFQMPHLTHRIWAYLFGFLGGMFGTAYSISGPPVIIYGTCRQWPPAQFKGNLQGYFAFISLGTVVAHFLNGNVTAVVWQHFLWTLPGIVLGGLAGVRLDGRINPTRFRQIVLILLVFLGIRLLF
ncbi:MAG: sulfite exporter TauE/SafE family protein [Chloroflexi bacterium]|nr:sulfite exporter TauE/SafE family protein [Chloroflexota bacterium]